MIISEEDALRGGLRYIADCLEKGEIYSPSQDEFIRGVDVSITLAKFARKLAARELPNWFKWLELQGSKHG